MGQLLFTLFIILGSIFLLVETMTFSSFQVRARVGPAFWPRIILIEIIVLGTLLLIKRIVDTRGNLRALYPRSSLNPNERKGIFRVLLLMLLCVVYTILINRIGFILTSLLFQLAALVLLGARRWIPLISIPVLLTSILYGLFIRIIHSPLPRGIGIFYDFSRLFY